ncbi:MAG: DUF1648 domain-containing protein [Oscillospiraceae bacterium]|jgi:uncharacterized membrane protein|nr:DUF1648 domain-containing protein [Oscillospiraceae bacterium]
MRKINWKTAIVTSLVALLPMVLGMVLLPKLPDTVAIHWGMNNEANGWVGKHFAVFGLPAFMALLQLVVSITTDMQAKNGRPKLAKIALWIIPVLSPILYTMTMHIALGGKLDAHLIPGLLLGTVFIVFGNYLPKIPQEQNGKRIAQTLSPEKYRKTMRRMGIAFLCFGVLVLGSLFFGELVFAIVVGLGILSILALSVVSYIKR